MLNRRILRIKAFKALYSSVILKESGAFTSIQDVEDELLVSCEAVRDLYILMMGLVSPLTDVTRRRIEAASQKRVKTEEEANPNRKFADNALASLLDSDIDFQKIWKKKKFSWGQYDLVLKKIYDSFSQKQYFIDYMASSERSLAEDCKLFTRIFEDEIVEAEGLEEILETMSIYWNDDLAYALTWCCKTFKSLAAGERWSLPPLYQSDMLAKAGKPADSDNRFLIKLFESACASYDKYAAMIADSVSSFDSDRLVATDVCIIACCLTEVATFPNIPVKVSINEYVEISKFYGTPKSSSFVNGLIDRLVNKLVADGLVTKE